MNISHHFSASRSKYKFGCFISWILAFILTSPVLYYSSVVVVGDNNFSDDQVCKITWISHSREDCLIIVNRPPTDERHCPHDQRFTSRCSFEQKPLEKVYLLFIVVVGIIIPISGTITAYHGLMSKVHEAQSRLDEIRDTTCQNSQKVSTTLKRNIALFSMSLLVSWIPLIIWNRDFKFISLSIFCLRPYLISKKRTFRYIGIPLTDKVCEGGEKLSSISPWMRFALSRLHNPN